MESQPKDPYLGTKILNQFRLERVLGAGGMGVVYQAWDEGLGRKVAVKILHRDLITKKDIVARFHREAQIAHQLDHPGIVRVVLFGQLADGNLYLVLEYLEGPTLMEAIERDRRFLPARAVKIVTQIGDAVGYTHTKGIIHRDLKPENIILTRREDDPEYPKVLDFGIAKSLLASHSFVTQTGLIFGTARYISPEGAAGEDVDQRSDVYSLAVIAYQLLAGRTPFEAEEPVQLLVKHMHEAPAPLRRWPIAHDVPPLVEDVVMRALAKNPEARHDNATEFARALRAALEGSGVTTPRTLPAQPVTPVVLGPSATVGTPSPVTQTPVPREGGLPSLVRTSAMPLFASATGPQDHHLPLHPAATLDRITAPPPEGHPEGRPSAVSPVVLSTSFQAQAGVYGGPVVAPRMEIPQVDPAALGPPAAPALPPVAPVSAVVPVAPVGPPDDDDLHVPGLPRRARPRPPVGAETVGPEVPTLHTHPRRSPAGTAALVLLSMGIAVGVAVGGAYGLRMFPAQQQEDRVNDLLRRADSAFQAGRLVHADNGNDVEDLTDAALALDPRNPRALRLRRNAAAQLKGAGDAERTAGRPARAIPFYQDALRLLDDATLRDDLAAARREADLVRPRTAPPAPAPARPVPAQPSPAQPGRTNPSRGAVVAPRGPNPAPTPAAPTAPARPRAPGDRTPQPVPGADPGITFTPGRDSAPPSGPALEPLPQQPAQPPQAIQPQTPMIQTPFGPVPMAPPPQPRGADPGVQPGPFDPNPGGHRGEF